MFNRETPHGNGSVFGMIVDEKNQRVAQYEQEGSTEDLSDFDANTTRWHPLDFFEERDSEVSISYKGLNFFRSFSYLNKVEIPEA